MKATKRTNLSSILVPSLTPKILAPGEKLPAMTFDPAAEAKKINTTINALSTIIMLIIVIKIVIAKKKDGRREKNEEN